MKASTKIKAGDAAVLAAVLALAAAVFFFSRGNGGARVLAEIIVDGQTVYEYDLREITEEQTLELTNGVAVEITPGGIRFVSSFCKGKDCVRCGLLTKAGQSAVCVPAKTVITLEGVPEKDAPDAMSY